MTNGRSRHQFELALLVWFGEIKILKKRRRRRKVPPPPKKKKKKKRQKEL